MTIDHCMFDFDGTLVDSLGDVLACLKTAFKKVGIPVDTIDVSLVMQLQLRESIASIAPGMSAREIAEVIDEFRIAYDTGGLPATKPMPGVIRLLDDLRARSIGMSIVSNKRQLPTLRILDKFGLRGHFTAVYNPDMYPGEPVMTKPSMIARAITDQKLSSEATIYIGDSEADVRAASENGLVSIIAANGYGGIDSFKMRPTHVVKEISDILTIAGLAFKAPPQ
jgi:phosphoglycolate phosphatase